MMDKSAHVSECRRYRYSLTRVWDRFRKKVCYIMLNPSIADASIDDPTIKKCMRIARNNGFGGIVVVNLFSYRSTDPRSLVEMDYREAGPYDDPILEAVSDPKVGMVVCAWSTMAGKGGRDKKVVSLLKEHGIKLHCIQTSKEGYAVHPLYQKDQSIFTVYEGRP